MKNFPEAVAIFNAHIQNYQKTCMYKQKIVSDTHAFFLNFNVSGKRYAGETGYQRSVNFINSMNFHIENGSIASTDALLHFAINYKDKGRELSSYIYSAILESAGFYKAQVDYFVGAYQVAFAVHIPGDPYEPDGSTIYPSRGAALRIIYSAIDGYYHPDICRCLNNGLGLKDFNHKDSGQILLEYLNNQTRENTFTMGSTASLM